jgi:hypothetical protein
MFLGELQRLGRDNMTHLWQPAATLWQGSHLTAAGFRGRLGIRKKRNPLKRILGGVCIHIIMFSKGADHMQKYPGLRTNTCTREINEEVHLP